MTADRRRVIWVPIIHSEVDLGRMREQVKAAHVRRLGRAEWEARVREVDRMWETLRARIESLRLDWSRVRLYQDGLPVCGHEERIVADMARAGSRNHGLLTELMQRGAALMGTESPELLLEEYHLAQRTVAEAGDDAHAAGSQTEGEAASGPPQVGRHRAILPRRDAYIARRIDETLRPGETGLLFLGMLHGAVEQLAPDIEVSRLRPDTGADEAS
ncbi:MAG: hypothetical protein R6X20_07750 [Phycisphaerae bacterium]